MRALWCGSIAIFALSSIGCVSVAPYEREYLSSPPMNAELEEGQGEFQAHVFDAREGATGGFGSTGGGCGCN
jgi:hypothetical protein